MNSGEHGGRLVLVSCVDDHAIIVIIMPSTLVLLVIMVMVVMVMVVMIMILVIMVLVAIMLTTIMVV